MYVVNDCGILKEEDKFSIASVYKIEPEEMEDYLPILANYRNLCAHEDVTFDHFTQRMIPDTKYHSILNIQKIDAKLFASMWLCREF